MTFEGEVILQSGGARFSNNYSPEVDKCKVCGSTVVQQIPYGKLVNGKFVEVAE